MKAILDILKALGINNTVFYQFGIFIVAFVFLNLLVFRPYLAAYMERRKRTVGSQDVAKELTAEIEAKESEYATEAKAINAQIKTIFEEKRVLAQKEYTAVISQAQAKAQDKLNQGKKDLTDTYNKAKDQLKQYIPDLGQTIKQRLLDR